MGASAGNAFTASGTYTCNFGTCEGNSTDLAPSLRSMLLGTTNRPQITKTNKKTAKGKTSSKVISPKPSLGSGLAKPKACAPSSVVGSKASLVPVVTTRKTVLKNCPRLGISKASDRVGATMAADKPNRRSPA
eukprot:Skav221503  [mRNA]  locus=scaffold2743:129277:139663:+ [translate_table: standard]